MASARPQLSLDELRQLKWLLGGLLAVQAIWTVLYLELDTWTLLIPATVAVAAAIVWPRIPSLIPAALHTLAFPIILVVFLGDLWLNGQLLPAMIRLDVLLIVYRCMSYRARRDDLQLIVLGLFLIVVAGVVTVSLVFALQILAFTGCALAFLFIITLVDAAEAKHPAPRTPLFTWGGAAETPGWIERADWGRLVLRLRAAADWRLLALGAFLFGGVVVVSGLLFLAIPRFDLGGSFFLERYLTRQARVGFSESIRFGEVTDIISDNSRALSVEITDDDGEPAVEGVPAVPYFRMVVLDEYRDGTFSMSPRLRNQVNRARRNTFVLQGTERERGDPLVFWTFYFEPGISRFLPIPGSYIGLRFQGMQNVSDPVDLQLVALENEPVSMVAYQLRNVSVSLRVEDNPLGRRRPDLRPPPPPGGRPPLNEEAYLRLPGLGDSDHAALERAITELTGGLTLEEAGRLDPMDFAGRVGQWLADRHTYSLQSALPTGPGDPVVRWIGGTSPGHCELFAGALVVLARKAGVHARAIAGFRGGTWNAFTGNLTVRNDNAHAWCEIWDRDEAWVRVDPTPGTTDEAATGTVLARNYDNSWAARLDSLRILWYRRVVNFNENTQRDVVRSVRDAARESGERMRALLDGLEARIKAWVSQPWTTRRTAGVATGAAALALAFWAWRVWGDKLRWGGGRGSSRRADPVRAEAGRWLSRFATLSAAGTLPPEGALGELTRLRYAAPGSWPKPERVFREARELWRLLRRSR
jgi:transglutaminase-like putative cysteine protease